jgi:hypothetical protein
MNDFPRDMTAFSSGLFVPDALVHGYSELLGCTGLGIRLPENGESVRLICPSQSLISRVFRMHAEKSVINRGSSVIIKNMLFFAYKR